MVLNAQSQNPVWVDSLDVQEVDNSIFSGDAYWRGADGASSIDLGDGRILWLFSDTFIDPKGTGSRSKSKMIRNSLAIQEGYDIGQSKMSFYYKGTKKNPESFFKLPGETWFWTGHGTIVNDKLLIFLFEEMSVKTGLGFEAIGWYIVIVDNPYDDPLNWKMKYIKGPDTFGFIIGSSAVLADSTYVYAYGVKEPNTHEVYLTRFEVQNLLGNNLQGIEWWINGRWVSNLTQEPSSSFLFVGQTEFSVHYQRDINKFIQIQTYGWEQASIGFRLAGKPEGPWSDFYLFYTPELLDNDEFIYSANAHPEMHGDGIIITYNVNNSDFFKLLDNERIYFPIIIKLTF